MRSGERPGEAGYNLVVLVMLITVMGIFLAAALPRWSAVIRRDKEEEAISRGWQYAEAIRVFQRRFGRLPNTLDELVEVEPRSIRRLWKDPLTDEGAWAVIVQTPQGGSMAIDPETGLPIDPLPAPEEGGGGPLPGRPPGQLAGGQPLGPGGEPQPIVGPIRGVKTRAKGEAFQKLFGNESYEQWEFTVDLLLKATAQPSPGGMPRWNALTIGRPLRFEPPGGAPGVGPMGGGLPMPRGGGLPGSPPPTPGPRPRPAGGGAKG